jgi:hypothetical protein
MPRTVSYNSERVGFRVSVAIPVKRILRGTKPCRLTEVHLHYGWRRIILRATCLSCLVGLLFD